MYSYNLTTETMQLSVSASILKVKLMMLLIWRDQTKARPTRLLLLLPRSIATEMTPKKPVAEMVRTEKRSVMMLIHLVQIFWLTMQTM